MENIWEDESITENISALQDWKLRARIFQQKRYKELGDRFYDAVPDNLLDKKIGFALYGPPDILNNDKTEVNYSKDKIEKIEKLKNHIVLLRKEKYKNTEPTTYLACLFICCRGKDGEDNFESCTVVFRILEGKPSNANFDNYMFVDAYCRTYKSWDDYIENNKLPKCDMCVPQKGFYAAFKGRVELSFHESPACDVSSAILSGLDVTSTVLGVAATCVSIACPFITMAAVPVACIALGANATIVGVGSYEVGRNIAKLVDRVQHDESLSLAESDSRNLWLGLATSSLGVATTGARAFFQAKSFLRTGKALIDAESLALRIAGVSSIAVSGIGVASTLITAIVEYRKGSLEMSHILQFTSACYFFANALISVDNAKWLIKMLATNAIKCKEMFTKRNNDVDVIRTLIDLRNSKSYKFFIEFMSLTKFMPQFDVREIDRMVGRLLTIFYNHFLDNFDLGKFTMEMAKESAFIWSNYKKPVTEAINKLLEVSTTEDDQPVFITPAHREIVLSKPDIARRLCDATQSLIEYCDVNDEKGLFMKKMITLVFDFNSRYQEDFSIDFLRKTYFVCDCIKNEFDKLIYKYELYRDISESNSDEFDENNFNRKFYDWLNFDIVADGTSISMLLLEKAMSNFYSSMDEMKEAYADLPVDYGHPKSETSPCLETEAGRQYLFNIQTVYFEKDYVNIAKDSTGVNISIQNFYNTDNGAVIIPKMSCHHQIKLLVFSYVEEADSAVGVLTVFD